jgi:hypothetical protein
MRTIKQASTQMNNFPIAVPLSLEWPGLIYFILLDELIKYTGSSKIRKLDSKPISIHMSLPNCIMHRMQRTQIHAITLFQLSAYCVEINKTK